MRAVATILALLALVSACTDLSERVEDVIERAEESAREMGERAPAPDEPTTDAGVDATGDADAPPGTESDPADGDVTPPPVEVNDQGPVGANGPAMLRAAYPRLVLEVIHQDGAAPDRRALDHVVAVLDSVADKPGGVTAALTGSFSSNRRDWSADALRGLARERRQQASGSESVAVTVLYLRGQFEDPHAIGVALNASVIALFPDRWAGLVEQLVGSGRAVERAVLTHEVGHLLGLVNLTYTSIHDREHPDSPGHSRNRNSVMYPAVATTAVGQVFGGPPPDDFDEADRHDLNYLRTGEW